MRLSASAPMTTSGPMPLKSPRVMQMRGLLFINAIYLYRMVRPKKHLGQHFLKDKNIAAKIVEALQTTGTPVLEIGPGTGVLTDMLIKKEFPFSVIEIDK